MGFVTSLIDFFPEILSKITRENHTGIIISGKAIRVTDLKKKNGKFLLNSFLNIKLSEKDLLEPEIADKLNQACIENCLVSRKVQNLATGEGTVIRNITIPKMEKDEIVDSLKYSEMDSAPFDIFEASVDAILLPSSSNGTHLDVVMGALDKKIAKRYSDFFKKTCLRHTGIGTIPDALSAILKSSKLIDKKKPVPIFNITEKATGIYIFKNDLLVYSRQIPLGAKKITKSHMLENCVSEKNDWDKAVAEYERSIDFFKNKNREEIGDIYLIGDTSKLEDIRHRISEETSYNFKIYNPFDDFIEAKDKSLQQYAKRGPEMALDIGLAISDTKSLNLLPRHLRFSCKTWIQKNRTLTAILAIALTCLFSYSAALYYDSSIKTALDKTHAEIKLLRRQTSVPISTLEIKLINAKRKLESINRRNTASRKIEAMRTDWPVFFDSLALVLPPNAALESLKISSAGTIDIFKESAIPAPKSRRLEIAGRIRGASSERLNTLQAILKKMDSSSSLDGVMLASSKPSGKANRESEMTFNIVSDITYKPRQEHE